MMLALWLKYNRLLSYLLEVIAIVILFKATWNVPRDKQNKLEFTSLDIILLLIFIYITFVVE